MTNTKKLSISIALLCTVVGIPLNGWVLSYLWNWFMIPAFGFSVLSVKHAIGLSMFTGFLFSTSGNNDVDNMEMIAQCIVYPFIMLGVGYILQLILF